MKKKYSVWLGAYGGASVKIEADEGLSGDDLYELASKKVCVNDATCSDWDGSYEIEDENGNHVASGEPI